MNARRASYTVEFKLKAVEFAKNYRNKESAEFCKISDRLVRRWKNQQNLLHACKKSRRSFRHGLPKFPELEADVKRWILEQRREKRPVSFIFL